MDGDALSATKRLYVKWQLVTGNEMGKCFLTLAEHLGKVARVEYELVGILRLEMIEDLLERHATPQHQARKNPPKTHRKVGKGGSAREKLS